PTLKALYIRGDDLLAVMRPLVPAPSAPSDWQTRLTHLDGLGSLRRLTDTAGNITDSWSYTAFGELYGRTGTDPIPYAFAGEPLDPNSGFQYHRARWMDSRVGRFVGLDPLDGRVADPSSFHRYLYVSASPTNLIDPSGLSNDAALVGTAIHAEIELLYPGVALRGAIPNFFVPLFPDIADLNTKEVIEIKPLSVYGLAGWIQLDTYVMALNFVGLYNRTIGIGWHPGVTWTPGFGPWLEPVTQTPYVVIGNFGGVLFYWVPPRKVSRRVLD